MSKPIKLLQINVNANCGSTGRIAEQINMLARNCGWQTYIAYGRDVLPSKSDLIYVGGRLNVYEHYLEGLLFDNDGLASRIVTRKFIKTLKKLHPDIIQLHNIHGHWLNYELLFEYLNTLEIPIVWTMHDPWPFGCRGYFSAVDCYKWRDDGCTQDCPLIKGKKCPVFFESTSRQFELKRKLFTATKNMTIVSNSKWMEQMVKQGYLSCHHQTTILNGIDIDLFKPNNDIQVLKKYGISNTHYVVGVAAQWTERKHPGDYKKLSMLVKDKYKVVMVGPDGKLARDLQNHGIITIPKTENLNDLTAIYTGADVILNLSYEESFGLTSVEGYACGRPTIVYNCTASPELVGDNSTGRILEPGDIAGVARAIDVLRSMNQQEISIACRKRAIEKYDMNKSFAQYIALYKNLLGII